MKLIKVIVVSILLAVLTSTLYYGLFIGVHSPNKISTKKEAIIIVPGFIASCIIDDENIYWDPVNPIRKSKVDLFSRIKALILDEEGNTSVPMWAPTMKDDLDLVGGAINVSYDLFYDVKNRFEDRYDVMMFQYDWRIDNRISAAQLDTFIKENKWDKVILLGHSMGGVVISSYLTMGEKQREKVKMMSTFGTPYLGMVEIIGLMETGFFPFADDSLTSLIQPFLKSLSMNMPAIFQLLPSKYLLQGSYYANEEEGMSSFIRIEGENGWEYLTNWNDIKQFISSRPWAKYNQTEGKIGQVKDMYTNALQLQEDFFYKDDKGVMRHITEKVNSYYFAGATSKVATRIDFDIEGKANRVESSNAFHDGTVSKNSALINNEPDNVRYFLFEGYDHLALIYRNEENKTDPIDIFYGLVEELDTNE